MSVFNSVSVSVLIVLLIAGVLTGLALSDFPTFVSPQAEDIQTLKSEVSSLDSRIEAIQQEIEILSKSPPNASVPGELLRIQSDVSNVDERLTAIEDTILENPSKALEVTLLTKEVERLNQKHNDDIQELQIEISRVYDLTKWIVGLMFSMAVGLFTIAISNYLKDRQDRIKSS